MLQRIRARGAVRHAYPDHVFGAERTCRQRGHHRRVHAAGDADDGVGEPAPLELIAEEGHEPLFEELRVDVEWGRGAATVVTRGDDGERR